MGTQRPGGRVPCMFRALLVASVALLTAAGASHCRVGLCSRHYARDTENDAVTRGPSYRYCTILRTYAECIRATARSCRGNLEYHSISSLVIQWNNEFNCSHIITQGPPEPSGPQNGRPTRLRPTASAECTFRSAGPAVYSHCGLFGDPHLRTFYNELQTCRVLGAWPLIDNPYLAVQVTNDAVMKGSSATATSKVTVIIRDHGPCTPEKTYEAQTDYLPGVFVDGSRNSGPERSVRIREEDPGRHVEIHIRHIGTRIIIRQVGRYLTFAVRMPQEVAIQGAQTETLELCVKGCPKRERIEYPQLLAHPDQWISMVTSRGHVTVPVNEAVATCKQYNVTDFYFDACVFDLLTTGDSTFSMAAREAMHDVLTLYPAAAGTQENRTALPPPAGRPYPDLVQTPENSAPGRPPLELVLLLCAATALVQIHV